MQTLDLWVESLEDEPKYRLAEYGRAKVEATSAFG